MTKKVRDRSLMVCSVAAALMAAAGQAHAQSACNGGTPISRGPDVIVGDVTGPQNYTPFLGASASDPADDTYDALALGTTSCNLGDTLLNWFSNTNEHPVIGGCVYKYKQQAAGYWTMEQIGQSWLKNAFYALSQTLCGSCPSSTDGTHLGICCSDPYTAGRNGSQSNMEPKWQVNAASGVYTYPPANPTNQNLHTGGTTTCDRRIKMRKTELQASGTTVRYYGECQYVNHDDATQHNNDNNASSRELNCTTTSNPAVFPTGTINHFNFGFLGNTVRTTSAVQMWKTIDSTVTESIIGAWNSTTSTRDQGLDGKMIVSSKATDVSGTLGAGWWHYEYVVYNMNSDRSVRGFSVPIDPQMQNTDVQNISFHDVSYFDGDGLPTNGGDPNGTSRNFDGADWIGSKLSSEMQWMSAQDYATNPNANAIRWANAFNFRFDAHAAPAQGGGNVTLTLFKPGTPTTVTAGAQVPGVIPNPPGACCVGASCTTNVTQSNCSGTWSSGNNCNWLTFCCPTNFDRDPVQGIPDIFGFIAFWFTGTPVADWNHNSLLDAGDVFAFIADWFVPC